MHKLMQATIYTKPNCSTCTRAKELLAQHQIEVAETVLDYGQGPDVGDLRAYIHPDEFKELFPIVKVLPLIVIAHKAMGMRELQHMLLLEQKSHKCASC